MTLAEALTAFATRRSAFLARYIEAAGRAVAPRPIEARRTTDFQRAWLAAVTDPEARAWCLDHLTAKLPKVDEEGNEVSWGDKCYALERRVDALVALEPDPRIARAMLARFELREPVVGFGEVTTKMIAAVARHADDGLGSWIATPGMPAGLAQVVLPTAVELSDDDRARFAVEAPAVRHDADALWAAIHAAPDDDGPRAVLADVLLERGDPRGELIALQLREARGEADDDALARATALVKEHGKGWLGALRPIVYRAELVRGALARIELAGSWSSGRWDELASDPLWGLVEEVEVGYANLALFAQILGIPALRSNLRSVSVEGGPVWDAVTASPLPRLRRLRCIAWKRGDLERRVVEDVLPFVERTPTLTALGLRSEHLAKIPAAVAARLVDLETDGEVEALAELWSAWPGLRSLATTWGDTLTLSRSPAGASARFRPSTFFKADGRHLLALPASIERLEIVGNAAFFRRARPVLGKRFQLVFRPLPSGLISNAKA